MLTHLLVILLAQRLKVLTRPTRNLNINIGSSEKFQPDRNKSKWNWLRGPSPLVLTIINFRILDIEETPSTHKSAAQWKRTCEKWLKLLLYDCTDITKQLAYTHDAGGLGCLFCFVLCLLSSLLYSCSHFQSPPSILLCCTFWVQRNLNYTIIQRFLLHINSGLILGSDCGV